MGLADTAYIAHDLPYPTQQVTGRVLTIIFLFFLAPDLPVQAGTGWGVDGVPALVSVHLRQHVG